MDKVFNKILIIDGSHLLHRQLRQEEIKNAICGFLRSLNSELKKCNGYFPIVVFDHGLSQRRIAIDSSYKHADEKDNTEKVVTVDDVPNDYVAKYRKSRTALSIILKCFGIPVVMYEGFEGDDLICVLTKLANDSIVLTDDKDMLQLISKTCKVRRPIANELWDNDKFTEKYGTVKDFVIYKSVVGDESDNIVSSCKGVGEKYALSISKLIQYYMDSGNLIQYPSEEKELKNVCEKLEIPYRKAYANLDIKRFLINLKLVDLSLVQVAGDIVSSVVVTIKNSNSYKDYFMLINELSNYDVENAPVESLFEMINSRYGNLFI